MQPPATASTPRMSRCTACQTPLASGTTRCDCGELIRVVPRAAPPRPVRGTGPREVLPIEFAGDGSTLFGMHLLNLALTAATLGIYHFWAKVKVRQYVYSMTGFGGDRFAYHGQGQELLLGWLKIAGIFGTVLGFGLYLQFGAHMPLGALVARGIGSLLGLFLVPIAMVGAARYRLTRTSWRGIRFSFRASTKDFLRLWMVGGFATLFSFGMYMPLFQNDVRRYMTEHVYFGNERFRYSGKPGFLFGKFLWAYVLFLPTFGLAWFWYRAERERYYWANTRFMHAHFVCTVTPKGLFKLTVSNFFIWALTFGLGKPWAQVRSLHYMTQNLKLVGHLDVDHIEQQAQLAGAGGEGLTDFVETGFFDVELGM